MVKRKKREKNVSGKNRGKNNKSLFNPSFVEPGLTENENAFYINGQGNTDLIDDEQNIFLEALKGVKPLTQKKRIITRPPQRAGRVNMFNKAENGFDTGCEDQLVSTSEMRFINFDGVMEGSVHGLSRKFVQKLKRGGFPVEDTMDLHGLTWEKAETEISSFVSKSYEKGLECVLLIHGKGLNSPKGESVIKDRLPRLLLTGPVKDFVIAFSTARPRDGGSGALYVLLKNKEHSGIV